MNDYNRKTSVVYQMFSLSIIGVIPLLCILYIYINDQNSQLLISMSAIAADSTISFSEKDPLLSVVMSLYVKTSPLYGVVFFIFSYKKLKVDKYFSTMELITTLVLFSFFYIFIVFFLLFQNVELTTSGRLLKFMSKDCYLLTLLFALVFLCCYVLTYCYVSFIYGCIKVFKERFLSA